MFNFALAKKVDSSTFKVDEITTFKGNTFLQFIFDCRRCEGLDPRAPFFLNIPISFFFLFICVIEKKALPLSPINGHSRHRSKFDA